MLNEPMKQTMRTNTNDGTLDIVLPEFAGQLFFSPVISGPSDDEI
jgi:hypothetical protein